MTVPCKSLACRSKRPHSNPNQHTAAVIKLIRDMRRRNPSLGMMELWHLYLQILTFLLLLKSLKKHYNRKLLYII